MIDLTLLDQRYKDHRERVARINREGWREPIRAKAARPGHSWRRPPVTRVFHLISVPRRLTRRTSVLSAKRASS